MILSEKDLATLNKIYNLRRQIDLLDSHRTVGLVTDKQYSETLGHIVESVEEIETEYGVKPPKEFTAFDVMFGESAKRFDKMMESFGELFS